MKEVAASPAGETWSDRWIARDPWEEPLKKGWSSEQWQEDVAATAGESAVINLLSQLTPTEKASRDK